MYKKSFYHYCSVCCRVPGNTAAVTSLTEAVNRGGPLDFAVLEQDQRWKDVNVISSLLKSFFRRLPDSLLTTELYPSFIQADKIPNPHLRMATIRKLVSIRPHPSQSIFPSDWTTEQYPLT